MRFAGIIREAAKALDREAPVAAKSLVKRIDEYNYAKFTKRWI